MGHDHAPGQQKKRPVAPDDATTTGVAGESCDVRQDETNVYVDCKNFDNPQIHVEVRSQSEDPTKSQGCTAALNNVDTDGDGNLTFHLRKDDWWLPDSPRTVYAVAWDDNDEQKVRSESIVVSFP